MLFAVHQNIEADPWNFRSLQRIAIEVIPAIPEKNLLDPTLAVLCDFGPWMPEANTPPVFKNQECIRKEIFLQNNETP